MFRRMYFILGMTVALAAIACDKVPLLAPTNSTLTIDAQTRVLPLGGSTQVSATVIESGGTPVQNGTYVRFTSTMGRLEPVEAQTHNGVAVTTFFAGNDSGIAEVRATSGGVGGTTSTTPGTGTPTTPPTTTTSSSNMVQISIGAGAVETVNLRVNPSVVSTNGGTVDVVATTVGANGRLLEGLLVSFSATRGTLSSSSAVTDGNGEARVTLRTNVDTDITATAGSKTSAVVKVTAQPGPSVQLTCAVGSVTNCATVTQGVAVLFTAQRASSSSVIVSSTLDYGDGASVSLGPLTNPVQASHSYTQNGIYTARLTATDANGESTSASLPIQVLAAVSSSVSAQSTGGLGVSATATVSAPVVQYAWTFEGTGVTKTTTEATTTYTYASSGTKTVSVTATLTDGRTTTATTTVVVP